MNHSLPEINELLLSVERKYEKSLLTTTDFDEFSLHLKTRNNINISTSTLKRLWGYVNDKHKPRVQTLDLFACYLGFRHFADFCHFLKTSNKYNSSFFSANQIQAQNLPIGAQLEIGWAPNRHIKLLHKGNKLFEVLETRNSKLMAGDQFETITFLAGQPLSLSYIQRGEQRTPPFIGGRNGGLTLLKVLSNE